MAMDKKLFGELRKLDRHDLRRVLIFARGLLMTMGDDAGDAVELNGGDPSVTYRLETVKCGKPNCKACPHGPYWYAYFREGKKLKSRYIGPELPAGVQDRV
jgi:hypothetical protein